MLPDPEGIYGTVQFATTGSSSFSPAEDTVILVPKVGFAATACGEATF